MINKDNGYFIRNLFIIANMQILSNALTVFAAVCKTVSKNLFLHFTIPSQAILVLQGRPLLRLNLKLWIIYQRASLSIIIYLCKSVIIRNNIAEASRYCNCYHKIFICFTSNIFISYTVPERFIQQQICILLKGSRGLLWDHHVIQ